jgi:hypothetical protein
MKTAVDWLVDHLYLVIPNEERNFLEGLRKEALEKEKEQIIEAGDACSLKAIAYHQKLSKMSKDELEQELVKDGMTHGEEYYDQTYNQNK